ncbi:hypothetical protein C8R44DRAFT_809985 [Mycena epipterygia]|nr:hypothetical protein C8R44DRAFT_809985 [Mycena epipterygia]
MDAVPLGFFDGFTTPALEKLEVTCLQRPSHLAALVQRSQCDLKTLVLRRGSVRISELLDVFELSPHITSFMLTNGCSTSITDRLLEALMIRDDRLNLLPKLNRLVIDGSAEPALDARTYVDLTLQDRPVEKDNVGRLRGLQGIKVSLHCLLDELDNVNLVGIL